jgi:hypothetical protein
MSALVVLMWALQLLARSAASLPIELVLGSQPGIAATVEVFVGAGSGVSSTPAASDAFETARLDECMSDAATKLASVLAYGEWHMVDGRDERGALEPQLAGLTRVGVSVVSTFLQGTFRALQITAIEEQLGLKLVPARAPQDFIVVDRVERPSPD